MYCQYISVKTLVSPRISSNCVGPINGRLTEIWYDREKMNSRIKKSYFGGIVALIVGISILNAFAYEFYWYWKIWWFDMIMHTLGGVWVGSFFLWYYFFRKQTENFSRKKRLAFFVALSSVAVIGIGWELFEFSVDTFITLSQHDPVDTASDLFFDILGSVLAVFIFFLVYNKSKE